MKQIQYDTFYKFIVSIGIILIITPILGFHYILSGSYDIIISADEYAKLSSVSLKIMENKSNLLFFIYYIFPFILFTLLIAGIICLYWGGKRWAFIQKKLDKQIDYNLEKDRIAIKMSLSEIVNNTMHEVDETLENNTNDESVASINLVESNDYRTRLINAFQAEDKCFTLIRTELSSTHTISRNIKVNGMEYDIIATSERYDYDNLYEIKYWTRISSLTLKTVLERIQKAGDNYEQTLGRKFQFILMIVLPSENAEQLKTQIEKIIHNSLSIPTYMSIRYVVGVK